MASQVMEFISMIWGYMDSLVIPIYPFVFSFADIIKTEIVIFISALIIDVLWHIGVYKHYD